MGISPIAVGMTGLQFALFANALALLGVDADERESGPPVRTVGAAGSLIGAIGLLFMAAWFVIGAPLGETEVPVQETLSLIGSLYGFLFLGLAITQIRGWDLRPIGNVALMGAIIQVIAIIAIARWGLTTHLTLVEIILIIYTLVLLGLWAATHGKFSLKGEGYLLLLAALGTFYLQFWASGIFPTP